ncbi:MarR family winged helix-turn-helix transcriptional regulator [[Eubacterium] hominis]|uniref:MarR family winged helix-turn-helix transcriptional regulator n=1 Tax=[Eubacterium] hominis TaxID=2764325 RepID=UPI003A4E3473
MSHAYMIHISLIKRLYDQCMEPVLQQYGIKRMELDILLFLANNPQFDTASDIIHCRGLSKSHVSTSIQHLIDRDFLSSWKHEDDKKKIHLQVKPAADVIIEAGRIAQSTFFQTLVKDFTKEEVAMLSCLFEKMETNIRHAVK